MPPKLKLLQSVDRLLGPWLFRQCKPAATGLSESDATAGRSAPPDMVRRVLIIRPGGLGDAVLTYPMLTALRAGFPDARIDALVEARNAGIYRINNIVDEIYRYDTNPLTVFRHLKKNRYDLIIDTEQYHHLSTLLANALQPRVICGFETLGRARFLTHGAAHDANSYEVFSFLRLAETVLGTAVVFDPNDPFIKVRAETLAWADQTISTAGIQRFAVIAPGAGGAYKIWPAARYAEIASWLTARNYPVILLGGDDASEAANQITADAGPGPMLNLVGQTNLSESAGLLQRASLCISSDTGAMHLAAAVGTPTVSLFGPGEYLRWAPSGEHHRMVRKGLACSPCTRFGQVPRCPYNVACMREISVNEVITACDDLLRH
jgi:lipopolysaccharide heptosyltransferase II